MNLFVNIMIITLEFFLMLFMMRGKIKFFLDSKMSKSNRRKINKNTSFWSWLFYKKYIKCLPKEYLVCYFFHFIIYPILVVTFIILYFLNRLDYNNIDGTIIYSYFIISFIPLFVLKT